MEPRKVVVVGRGFGGLTAVRALKGVPVAITLIDKTNYHLFQPLLYQMAVAALRGWRFSGLGAWLIWSMVHLFYRIWYYLTYKSGERLIERNSVTKS